MDEHTPEQPDSASTWGSRLRRRRVRPPRRALFAAVLLHVFGVVLLWLAGVRLRPDLPEFLPYTVTLVSPPAAVQGEPEPVVTNTPVVVAEPEPAPKPQPPKPREQTRTQAPTQRPVERTPDPTPAKGPDPKPVSVSGENMDVRIEGQEFPYPEYLEDMVAALMRIFRWTDPSNANLEATVVFAIQRNGSVKSITLTQRSGNYNFNEAALAAVEQAGKISAFDPLPEGLQGDRLWISFTFKPKKN